MKWFRFFLRYMWLWFLLAMVGAVLVFTLAGNDSVLPAIYR